MRLSHFAWNLLGLGAPLVAAAVAVPVLMANLGAERFGLLALAWAIVGLATSVDLGIGRAITHTVARLETEDQRVGTVLHTGVALTGLAGVLVMCLLVVVALLGATTWLKVDDVPAGEVAAAAALLAVAIPAQAMTATYRGLNEAKLQFVGVNGLRALQGLITFIGPAAISFFTLRLEALVAVLVLGRWLGWAVSRGLALSCLSTYQKRAAAFSGREASALFAFAGWVTLSSLLTPVFLQADRFVIGAMISASAVTTYVVPHELVVQTLVVVGAFSSVFFPTLSAMVRGPEAEWRPYYLRWALRLLAAMAGLLCMLAIALPHILQLWLGQMVSAESWEVGRILCLGVFFGAVGSVFFALLHARGRPDLTAKAHLIELPVFLFVLQASVMQHGISGAAWAWTLRMGFDAVLLALAARRV